MLRLNWKKLLLPALLLLIYLVMALLVIPLPQLKRIWLILFGVHCLICIVFYIGVRVYRSRSKELVVSPEELKYLQTKHSKVVSPKQVKNYYLKQTVFVTLPLVVSGLPLLLASIQVN